MKLAHKEMARFQQESDSAIVSKGANNNAASQVIDLCYKYALCVVHLFLSFAVC